MTMPAESSEAQLLRRRELWFRQFGRLGAPQDRSTQDEIADGLHRQALREESEIEQAVK